MSMTLANADTYISRIIGGSGDTGIKAQARDALTSAMEELLHRNNWTYLRQDTSLSFTVAAASVADTDATVTTTTTNGFKNVLVGMTITDATGNIPADTTVASITSNTSLEMSAVATGTKAGSEVLTFGGTIPIVSGTEYYNLPTAFWKPMSARLTSTRKDELSYIPPGRYDATSYDQTVQGTVVAYTIYNANIFDASGTQQTKIRFIRKPGAADVCLLKYYRLPDLTGTYVDVPDEYLYTFLDMGRVHLLRSKDAASRRLPILIRDVEQRIARAISADREEGGDAQMDRFNTPNELEGGHEGRIWPTNYLGRS